MILVGSLSSSIGTTPPRPCLGWVNGFFKLSRYWWSLLDLLSGPPGITRSFITVLITYLIRKRRVCYANCPLIGLLIPRQVLSKSPCMTFLWVGNIYYCRPGSTHGIHRTRHRFVKTHNILRLVLKFLWKDQLLNEKRKKITEDFCLYIQRIFTLPSPLSWRQNYWAYTYGHGAAVTHKCINYRRVNTENGRQKEERSL
jgi:hypothetical protein